MSKYTANPRSKSMVLEVDRLLKQLGVHEPTPEAPTPVRPPVRLVSPVQAGQAQRGVKPLGSPSPSSGSPSRSGMLRLENAESSGASPKGRTTPTADPKQRARRAALWSKVALWARVSAGIALGVAMTQWPYRTECGWALSAYLGAVATVLVAGGWTAFVSWKGRSAPAHVLSLMLIFWGFVLAAQQSLPRIGYAAEQASWSCDAGRSR